MNHLEALLFTGKCLTLGHYPDKSGFLRDQILSGKVDWEQIVWVSTSHLVFPALHLNLKKAGLLPDLPTDLVEYMEEFTGRNRDRNLMMIDQVREITVLLNEKGIEPVYLKGAGHLLDGLYGDIAERMMGDIDLLVRDEDMIKAAETLISAGYRTLAPVDPHYIHSAKHYPRLFLDDRIAGVELHRRFVRYPDRGALDIESVYQDREKLNLSGSAYVLSHKHQIIQNIYHVQIDHDGGYHGDLSLRQCYDLFCMAQRVSPVDAVSLFGKHFQRMNANIAMANYVLGNPSCLVFERSCRASLHLARIKTRLKHPGWARIENILLFLINRFWLYLKRVAEVLFSAGARRSLIGRLTNPKWYKAHWGLYRAAFRKHNA